MKVLLVSPTVDTCYERVASIGLMNLYLIAKGVGCEVEYLDLTETSYSEGLKYIISKRYDVIGISCNFTNAAPYCIQYSKDIKERHPDTLVISGGNHATLVPEDLLLNGYDYIIYGEGESAFKIFLKRVLSRKSLEDLKGIYYLKDGNIIKNLPFEQIEDLDTLPLNDYSNFDLEPYFKKSGLRYISLETSRGCIHNCSFCSTVRMWGHNYRQKSPQRVLKEFKIAQDLNLDFVFIEDDDVAINEKGFRDFCQLLIDEEISVSWGCTIGSKSIKDFSTFDIMSKSGCIKVNICVESANSRALVGAFPAHHPSEKSRFRPSLKSRNPSSSSASRAVNSEDSGISESTNARCSSTNCFRRPDIQLLAAVVSESDSSEPCFPNRPANISF